MPGFRLLELLNREGAQVVVRVAEKSGVRRQAGGVIARLERRNWVRRAMVELPHLETHEAIFRKAEKTELAGAAGGGGSGLTALREEIHEGCPAQRHSKMVKSLLPGARRRASRHCGAGFAGNAQQE